MWRVIVQQAARFLALLGVVLFVLLLGELARLYVLLDRISPHLSWAYFCGLAGLGIIILGYLLWLLRRYPPIPQPPRDDAERPDHVRMKRYCRYLVRYAAHLGANPRLTEEHRQALAAAPRVIQDVLRAHPLNDDLQRVIRQVEEQRIGPALRHLDEQACAEVRHSVRDVMLAVTLSPYPAMDLLIVLYRNMAMTGRLLRLYHGRPRLRDQWRLFRDVLVTVATVNVLNLTRKLFESLLTELPLLGRVMESIGQGLGAGLMTSITGHAAMDRCAAFRGWDADEEARSLAGRVGSFLQDVRDLFGKDLLPQLKGVIRSNAPPGAVEEPGFWDSIVRGINTAVDLTARVTQTLVVQPVVAVGAGVAQVGLSMAQGAASISRKAARSTHRQARRTSRGVGRALKTFGQRLFYTLRGPRFLP